jgi:general secretion pathway protein A
MKMRMFFLAAVLSAGVAQGVNADAMKAYLGEQTKGGYPEYVFIEKAPGAEVKGVAELLAKAIIIGRVVIFRHLGLIHDAKKGDKGFTADFFEKAWKEAMAKEMSGMSPAQQSAMQKLFHASKVVMDANQARINLKGIKFKYFLPASWSRETSVIYKAMTGIVIKQPAKIFRNNYDQPDEEEMAALTKARSPGFDGKGFGQTSTMGKQAVYRHYEPVAVAKGCLGCHGEPKGKIDILGYEKEGQKVGEIRALVSVTVPIE